MSTPLGTTVAPSKPVNSAQPLGDGGGRCDDEVAAAQEAAEARAQVRVAHGARDEGRVGVGVQVVARVVGEDERDALAPRDGRGEPAALERVVDVDDVECLGEAACLRGEREREAPAGLAPRHAGGAHDVGLGVVVVAVAEREDEHLVAEVLEALLVQRDVVGHAADVRQVHVGEEPDAHACPSVERAAGLSRLSGSQSESARIGAGRRQSPPSRRIHCLYHSAARCRSPKGVILVALSLAIVGLPNVGKSTLFTALTRKAADAANYPFATIEPNVGLVTVPDSRLDALAEIVDPAAHHARGRRVRRRGRARQGRERGRGPRQPVPRQHPRDATRSARSSASSPTRTSSTSRAV